MKPDVIKQMVQMEKARKIEMERMRKQHEQNQPTITFSNGVDPPKQLSLEQVVGVLQQQQQQINYLTNLLKGKEEEIKILTDIINNRTDC
jgi:hypothetical protein